MYPQGGVCFPLAYKWYGKFYYGAAHGLAGIVHVLLLCHTVAGVEPVPDGEMM